MGASFSSNQLAAAPSDGIPTLSYAYASDNPHYFGVDATYIFTTQAPYTPVGEITPYLVQPSAAPTLTCQPFEAEETAYQSLICPVVGASLASGLYTISFSQYPSASAGVDDFGSTYYTQINTVDPLTQFGAAATFSIVPPQTIPTTTITSTVSTILTSGVSEIPGLTTTIPATIEIVTVYQTTIISTFNSISTLTGASLVTVTGTCSSSSSTTSNLPSTLQECHKENCLRALLGKKTIASSFCSNYLKTPSLPTPTYAKKCSGCASKVSSACSCVVTPVVDPKVKLVDAKRGAVGPYWGAPDFTYGSSDPVTVTVYVTPVTVTSGPVPSTIFTDPDSTLVSGTAISTDNEASTVTITVFQSTVDLRTASTVTVSPSNCGASTL